MQAIHPVYDTNTYILYSALGMAIKIFLIT